MSHESPSSLMAVSSDGIETAPSKSSPRVYAVEIFGHHGEATIEYRGRRYLMFATRDGQLHLVPQDRL